MPYIVYILECADGSYYTGSTDDINKRLWQHEQGVESSSYTFSRCPLKLVKKQALIRGDFDAIHEIVKAERKKREQNKRKSLH